MKTIEVLLNNIQRVKEFNAIVSYYPYDIDVKSDRYLVNAKSIMGIFSIDLSKPVEVQIHSNDYEDLLLKLKPFMN
jgi:phosphocarrier protein HPr